MKKLILHHLWLYSFNLLNAAWKWQEDLLFGRYTKGVTFVSGRYTKGESFLPKVVYKRVRDRTSGRGLSVLNYIFFVLIPSSIEDSMFTKRLSLTLCNEHLCLRLISIGRPFQSWKIQKVDASSSVQTHSSAVKSNIGSGNKLQVLSCLQRYSPLTWLT